MVITNSLRSARLFLFVAAMWLTNYSFAVTETLSYADFLADPNWTVPAGVVQVTVQVWGSGGGAGGGASADDGDGGGGGGGGGYSTTVNIVVVPGASHAFVVGLGGPGGPANNGGTAGLTSSLLGVSAGGGGGGVAGSVGGRAGGIAGTGDFAGGAGGNGSNNKHGGGGGEGGCFASAGATGNTGGGDGAGGSSCAEAGDGASATQAEGAAGVNAVGIAGGGGGASGNQTGGAGADGQIVLTYVVCCCDPCYSAASGNWDNVASWSATSGGAGGATPTAAGGNVHPAYVIEGTDVVNMNVAGDALSLRVGDADAGQLLWTAAVALTIHGDAGVVVDADGTLTDAQGAGSGITFDHQANGTAFVFSNAGIVSIGDLNVTETGGTGNSTSLTTSGAGTIAIVRALSTVATSAEIQNDGTITANTFSSTGAGMTLDNNGTLTIATTASIAGTNTIDNAGNYAQTAGDWTSTGDGVVFTNSGTANIDAGNMDFGDFTGTVTNSSNFNLDGDFRNITAAEVTWNNINGGSMTYSGAATQDADLAIVANAATNTWSYDRAGAQNVYAPAAGYYNLTVDEGNTKTMQAATTVLNTVGLTNGVVHTNGFNLAHTNGVAALSVTGGSSASYVRVTDGVGIYTKSFAADGNFVFHVGGATEYSPITYNMTGSGYAGAYVGMRVIESAHADLAASTDFLTRMWVSTSAGITSPSYTVSAATYLDDDITGTEANIEGLSNSGDWVGHAGVSAGTNTFGTGVLNIFGLVTGGVFAVLPVELLSFSGECLGGEISFSWTTAAEINNSHFEILASVDGFEYESVGFVEGSGNSFTPIDYKYHCTECLSEEFKYYKLQQEDYDGVINLYDAVHLSCNKESSFIVYPTLVSDAITVLSSGFDLRSGNASLQIFDQQGIAYYRTIISREKEIISIRELRLAAGVYHVVLSKGAVIKSKLFIKK
ncbi:MAG: hypothetical protein ACJAZ2_000564 [Glaciecola sp.]|jgi:hypothetical protein